MASKLEKFQELDPLITKIKIHKDGSEVIGWELFDEVELIGYGFNMKVPEQSLDIELAEEFDMYDITGIVDLGLKLIELNIEQHEDYTGVLWAEDIVEDEFKQQYMGLSAEAIKMAPEGPINAITESTLSSKAVTDSIKAKIEKIAKFIK